MKKLYLLLLICCVGVVGYAQTAASYTFNRTTGTFNSISGTGTLVSATDGTGVRTDDGNTTAVPLGFTFNFGGAAYTTGSMCSNGVFSLQSTSAASCCTITAANIAGGGSAGGWLMPFWMDLYGTGVAAPVAYYQTTGAVGSRVFTIEWKGWNTFTLRASNPGASLNFQVKLYEGLDRVEFVYGSFVTDPGNTAVIGIANSQSDYQTLQNTTATACDNNFNKTCDLPASGTILQWCPPPPAIGGNTSLVCPFGTMTLTDALAGGTWTSGNTGIATIGSSSGIVTGVATGTAPITYTSPCGGIISTIVTVNSVPANPTGNAPLNVCASTTTLTDPTGAGTWTSSNTGIATIGSSSGIITGVAAGTATITFTLTSTGCINKTTIATVNPLPAITGTTNTCPGASSTLSHTTSGGSWTSSNTGVATVTVGTGIVTGVSAGTVTITYTVSGGCFVTTPFTVNPLPASIGGIAVVCVGQSSTLTDANAGGTWTSSNPAIATIGSSSGVMTGLSGGNPTITYTLPTGCFITTVATVNSVAAISGLSSVCLGFSITLSDATPGGNWSSGSPSVATIGPSSGIVSSVSLGSTIISYTVASTGCAAVTTVSVTNPPNIYTITGGGAYCAGGLGVHIGLNSSDPGVTYKLYNGITLMATVSGTGSSLDFGLMTATGTYTIQANPGTSCSAVMSGSVTVSTNPLPTAFSVGGGGPYCSGGSGVHITLNSSSIGVNYQLFYGASAVGSPIVGTSGSLDFGLVTAASPPSYTVVATNATTFCTNTMTGSASVSINPLPSVFAVTGGGSYCLGGSGVLVGLSSSTVGINYQLYYNLAPLGSPLPGTGSALNFGLQTSAGNYTVVATNPATGCSSNMSATAVVSINPLPTVFSVTGGGSYCLGTGGVAIGLSGSTIGVNYQLYNGASPVGAPLAGTGVSLNFGLQAAVGSYTVLATNATTACTNNMFGSASVAINPLPAVFAVTGGGAYCASGAGLHIGLASSVIGTTYQLYYNGFTLVGAAAGTGAALDFGLYTTAGTYTVTATITATGCTGNMSGSVTITINPLPNVYIVTGGGSYCATGPGVAVGLSGSDLGVNYQLYNGPTPVGTPVAGSGGIITFGPQTLAGSYSVVATNTTTTCTNNMTGSAAIVVNPLPTIYAVTGGGAYCVGGPGVVVGLSASNVGINYQLIINGIPGTTLAGTGAALSYGPQFTVGTYTIKATNPATTCTANMAGSVSVSSNPLPVAFTVSGGGAYCTGGAGMPVNLSGSAVGVSYQLWLNGTTTVGGPVAGTGFGLAFGSQTAAGNYTVVATNATTLCTANMLSSANVSINPLPSVFSVTGGGTFCTGGSGVHVGLAGSVVGTSYQLFNGVTPVGPALSGTGAALDFGFKPAGTYTVVATIVATGCSATMSGTAVVTANSLPGLFTIAGGGSYCAGGTGLHITLGGSAIGINYQLYRGATPVGSPLPGTSISLDFGLQTTAGTYTVIGTSATTGCSATMTGSVNIVVNPLPAVHNVTGGGSYCPAGTGVAIGLDFSNTGVNYQLYRGVTAIGAPVPGTTGLPVTFGLQTTPGVYTVKAIDAVSGCTANMAGSATVAIYSLPVSYNVTGGGSYCSDGPGVNVGLSGSTIGVDYQLYVGPTPVGSPVSGTGIALSFGLQTAPGNYTVIATNTTTGCSKNMNLSANVAVNPLPTLYSVLGGGNYCSGGTGLLIALSGSDLGTLYQLYNGISTVGSPVAGTGGGINFGLQTAPGVYTVVATNVTTTCQNTMDFAAVINIDPLPAPFPVTGGGTYCSGTGGVNIFLGGSDPSVNYQLYNGVTPVGAPQPGTGLNLTFGPVTAGGTYSIVGTNMGTGCNAPMAGTVNVIVNPLPTAYVLGGGGSYCSGGLGLHITLSGSNSGISYQLFNGVSPVGGPVAGTGLPLDFGLQTVGGAYTVVATNTTTGCTNTMTGIVPIIVNPLPAAHTVVSTSSNYCIGGTGVFIALDGTDIGNSYQLYNGSTPVGSPVAGTADSISFGYILPAGSYRVVAKVVATGCTKDMLPGVTITIDPLPTVYSVTGGGNYCSGGTGVHVGLSASALGNTYQLYNGVNPVGSPLPGSGGALDFGLQTLPGTYKVVATTTLTTCTNNMSGSATVTTSPLPAAFAVTGGGNYCAGGAGVHVGLSNSVAGVNYQLYRSLTIVGGPVAGTGIALDFGAQTGAGNYTVVAIDATTGCTNAMTGLATVNIDPLPTLFTVTGGGSYCPGGSGVHIGVSGSDVGVSYQLKRGTTNVGSPVAGTGGGIDFGLQTTAGTYTAVATNTSTGCVNTMSGSVAVMINTPPVAYTVIGGGSYCAGGSGVSVGINNSNTGVNYTLYMGTTAVATLPGNGSMLDFGLQTAAGVYTIKGTDATTTCSTDMSGSVTVSINPVLIPSVSIISSGGDTACSGILTTYTAVAVNGGTPSYVWTLNGTTAGTGTSYAYTPSNGDVLTVTMTSTALCASPTMASSTRNITVDPTASPSVTAAADPGSITCAGTLVTYTATPSYGGNAPTYSWIKNGVSAGSASTYSYVPSNGDQVLVVMTSNYHCRLAATATSNTITMEVDQPIIPVVTITSNPGNYIGSGQAVTLTTTVANGGAAPTYMWLLNGTPIPGATAATYTSNSYVNMDSVTCQVTASGGCLGLVGFNSVIMHVAKVGVAQVTATNSDIQLVPNPNKGSFIVRGTLGVNTDQEVSVELTNMLGQVIYAGKFVAHNGDLNEKIQLENTPANGMYLLNLRSDLGTKTFHMVIEQ